MKKILLPLSLMVALAAPQLAGAAVVNIFSSTVGGAPAGNTFVTFDDLPLGSAGGESNGVIVNFGAPTTAKVVTGSVANRYAAPVLSGDNGDEFGQPNGKDTTPYITTGIDSVELVLETPSTYFGLLWGSVDKFNSLEFFDGLVSLGTFTGADVAASPNGIRDASGTYYVNISSPVAFDRVVASSTQYAFEFDNVSYNSSNVPEGGATLALLGSVIGGLAMVRRFKK